jgi:hypothetical protein
LRAKRFKQLSFNNTRSFEWFHLCGERLQPARQHRFITKATGTIVALVAVGQGFVTLLRGHHPASRQLTHHALESLTVHAKHLADFTVVELVSSTPAAGLNFTSNSARARCKRDRIVPIAQPKISAVSP